MQKFSELGFVVMFYTRRRAERERDGPKENDNTYPADFWDNISADIVDFLKYSRKSSRYSFCPGQDLFSRFLKEQFSRFLRISEIFSKVSSLLILPWTVPTPPIFWEFLKYSRNHSATHFALWTIRAQPIFERTIQPISENFWNILESQTAIQVVQLADNGVSTVSRIDEIIGLFYKRAL